MRTFLAGVVLQLLPFLLLPLWGALSPVDPEVVNPWIVLGGVGTAGAFVSLLGLARTRTRVRVPGVIFSLIGAVGWGSWLLVGVQYGLDEPVINITGLLVVLSTVGLLLCVLWLGIRQVAGWRPRGTPPPTSAR